MSKPFDATTKQLIEAFPLDFLRFLAIPADQVRLIDTDLATVTTATDRAIRIESPQQRLVHIELEARRTPELDQRMLEQSVLLTGKHQLPVESVAFLLRRRTQASRTTGRIEHRGVDGRAYLTFRYRIVRLWEVPVETLLSGGIGLLPLAPLGAVEEAGLPQVIRTMEERIDRDVPDSGTADILWVSTYILLGVHFEASFIQQLLQGVQKMKESTTYQLILSEGRAEGEEKGRVEGRADEARRLILRIGAKRFGAADASVVSRLDLIGDTSALESLADRLLEVESWNELLAPLP